MEEGKSCSHAVLRSVGRSVLVHAPVMAAERLYQDLKKLVSRSFATEHIIERLFIDGNESHIM